MARIPLSEWLETQKDVEGYALGDWLQCAVDSLMSSGFRGEALKAELRRVLWLQKRDGLQGLIGAARTMEESWRIRAECFEHEYRVLMASIDLTPQEPPEG